MVLILFCREIRQDFLFPVREYPGLSVYLQQFH